MSWSLKRANFWLSWSLKRELHANELELKAANSWRMSARLANFSRVLYVSGLLGSWSLDLQVRRVPRDHPWLTNDARDRGGSRDRCGGSRSEMEGRGTRGSSPFGTGAVFAHSLLEPN